MLNGKPKRFDNMNVIPLIDVMLVLLAIVLMTASFITKDNLNLELPETENTQSYTPENDLKTVHFNIDAGNQYFIDEKPTQIEEIKSLLATYSKDQAIVIQVDKKADFGPFVELIDQLKGQKLNNLTILTQSASE